MTLDEKVSLLAGRDLWRTGAVPRLGISKIKTSDGPVGVRGGIWTDGVTAASLPTGVLLAATWDPDVVKEVCQVLVAEAKSKEVDVLLGPTVCIPRSPLGGRNFEAYSEDPFLTGKLAATFINTVQNGGIAACIKHFVANDQETRRFFIDELIPDRALREIHLQPFQIAIRDSDPWTLMTAYNKVNGTYCSAHDFLLERVLRTEWGWDGLVMSDWFGTNSIVPSLLAGVDLEMPGPARRRGRHLLEAHRQGLITTTTIDASASRLLELLYKTGKSEYLDWQESTERAVDLPKHRRILRRAGAEGIVLLKNKAGLLPLHGLEGKRIAVIGPNVARSVATGGGSSNLNPHYKTTPYKSLKTEITRLYPTAAVSTAPGVLTHRYLPLVDPAVMRNPVTGESGFELCFWRNMFHAGQPFLVESRPSSNLVCYDGLPPELKNGDRYSYRARCVVTPKTTGLHQFSLSTCGPGKLLLDGRELLKVERRWWSPKSSLFMSYGSPEQCVEVHMDAGREYHLVLESVSREPKPYTLTYTGMLEREEVQDGGRIGFFENPGDLDAKFNDAVELARSSDVVIVVVGRDSDWETESSDILSLDLPGRSNDLIAAVAGANPNTIVVNQTGGPIAMPWVDQVSSIVQAWYQGQEQGNCIADVLLGATNPCGKLPVTFPRRLEDTPCYGNFPGEEDVVHYTEGIYVGYRHYDARGVEPLFPFGFGLSYTTFEYSNLRLSSNVLAFSWDGTREDGQLEVSVDVKNTGTRPGKEVVQFYITQLGRPRLERPPRELKGWAKVSVGPGETVTARTTLDRVSVSQWDDGVQMWVVDANAEFSVTAARHSRDEGVHASFRVPESLAWLH
ncbi:glycoside hydrolase superfamily [Coniochaeta sp. 2T2.1]|nr:glycoside hydrolase superfamily [Coniochaeta sp. 2T2.1]